MFSGIFQKLGIRLNRDAICIPFWKQWAFKWSTPQGIHIMIPGMRIYGPSPKLPKGTTIHITAGQWKTQRFYQGKIHRWILACEMLAPDSQKNPKNKR